MKTYNHYINDEWVEPSSGAYLDSENPFTGENWARIARGNAEAVVEALREERFLVLPHPEVAEYVKRKGIDRDRWLKGMRRFQDKLYEGKVPPGKWLVPK